MIRLSVSSGSTLVSIIDALKTVRFNLTWSFTPTGIEIMDINTDRTEMVMAVIHGDEYTCDTPVDIGVDMTHLANSLKGTLKKTSVEIEYRHDLETLVVTTRAANGLVCRHMIKPMKVVVKHAIGDGLPSPEKVVAIPSSVFQGALKHPGGAKYAYISHADDTMTISLENPQGSRSYTIKADAPGPVTQGIYPMDRMTYYSGFYKLADTVEIGMRSQNPITIRYNCGSLGSLAVHLAPCERAEGAY